MMEARRPPSSSTSKLVAKTRLADSLSGRVRLVRLFQGIGLRRRGQHAGLCAQDQFEKIEKLGVFASLAGGAVLHQNLEELAGCDFMQG